MQRELTPKAAEGLFCFEKLGKNFLEGRTFKYFHQIFLSFTFRQYLRFASDIMVS